LDFAEREMAEFYRALRYVAVEQSAARRGEHTRLVGHHIASGRARSAAELPQRIPIGCIFSNELVDALPVHRVGCERGELREIYVGLNEGALAEQTGALSTLRIAAYFDDQGIRLDEGQQAEAGLAACEWIGEAAERLHRGFVLTVDYGYEAAELYSERH